MCYKCYDSETVDLSIVVMLNGSCDDLNRDVLFISDGTTYLNDVCSDDTMYSLDVSSEDTMTSFNSTGKCTVYSRDVIIQYGVDIIDKM